MPPHHALILLIVALSIGCVVREFLQFAAGWGRLATRYVSRTPPAGGWQRLPFLWLEWQQGGTLRRASYGRSRLTVSPWGQLWETALPSLRVAASERGLHMRRQSWHFKQAPLLIPWTAVSEMRLLDGSEMVTFHGGSLPPDVGAAMQARLPKEIKGALDSGVGKVARIELKEPEMRILVPLEAIADAARYMTLSADSTPRDATAGSAILPTRTVWLWR